MSSTTRKKASSSASNGYVRLGPFQCRENAAFGMMVLCLSSSLLVIVVLLSHVLSHHDGAALATPDFFAQSLYLRHHDDAANGSSSSFSRSSIWNDVKESIGLGDMGLVFSDHPHSRSNPDGGVASAATTGSSSVRRKKVAYAITITKDGFFQDGAAVLAYSIIKQSQQSKAHTDISLVAFVHPLVVEARPLLVKLGFHVIETPMPINITAIEHKFLREKINLNGCCGASELIKLNAYRLSQYDNVVHMDADTMVINPINELIGTNYSLIYTTDPNMATHKGEDKMPSQGGFLVLKPSEADFRSIVDTIMTTPFVQGGAWNGSKIGWFWGGMTVQGILPYYYNKVTVPNTYRRKIVDRCYYNTMADTKECEKVPLRDVKTAHFTVCQKPWTCYGGFINPLCKDLHEEWFRLRTEAERFYGVEVTEGACQGPAGHKYKKMKLDTASMPSRKDPKLPPESAILVSSGQQQQQNQQRQQLPVDMLLPVPDESPELLEPPFPESRYTGRVYDNLVGGHVNKPPKKKPKKKPNNKKT